MLTRGFERRAGADGYALLSTIVVIAVLLTIGASTIQLTRTELHSVADQVTRQQAFYIAEAGVQRGIAQLDWERAMASTYTTYTYNGSSESFGNGSYVVTIAQDPQFSTDPTRKLITSTGTKSSQSAQVVAHAVVQPVSSSLPPSATPTLGANTSPTPGGSSSPTPPGAPPATVGPPAATSTPGPAPTSTAGVPPGMPTPTATPSTSTNFPPCNNREILVSYNGTAKVVNTVSALANFINGNGVIFSNNDVTFQTDVAIASAGTGSVNARGNFNNTGLGLGLLSSLTNVSLFYGGSYSAAPLDTHLLGCPLSCFGTHFANGGATRHGVNTTIARANQWRPDYQQLKRFANVVVNKSYQPFGSWDSSSGTWVVGGYSFPAGNQTLYYVEGNVRFSGLSLFRTASPRIVARGWISMTSLNVLSSGLLANDVQNIFLIAEKDVMIGRDVINLTIPTFVTEASAIATVGLGVNLATALSHSLNTIAYSERGEVWGMLSTLNAASFPRVCFLANQNATLAFTAGVASAVRPLN